MAEGRTRERWRLEADTKATLTVVDWVQRSRHGSVRSLGGEWLGSELASRGLHRDASLKTEILLTADQEAQLRLAAEGHKACLVVEVQPA